MKGKSYWLIANCFIIFSKTFVLMSISRCLSEKRLKYILDVMDLFVSSGKSYIRLLLQSQSELKLWQARMGLLRASAVQCVESWNSEKGTGTSGGDRGFLAEFCEDSLVWLLPKEMASFLWALQLGALSDSIPLVLKPKDEPNWPYLGSCGVS